MTDHEENLAPHPLVVALAQGLLEDAGTMSTAASRSAPEQVPDDLARRQELADALAADPNLPGLRNFAGFLGGKLDDSSSGTWQLLYLDAKLLTWLLVRRDDIVCRQAVKDDTAPFAERDVIWLKTDASLSRGSGPLQRDEVQARFLRGDFTRAEDLAASLTGGTFSAATGIFCEANTVGCCGRNTRR